MRIGAMLKYWRQNKKLTYYKIAKESGIDADYIKRIEESAQENTPNIKIDTLDRLAKAVGVPASELINDNEEIMYLSERERKLITAFRRFKEPEQDAIITVAELISNKYN